MNTQLIKKARTIPCTRWYEIYPLMEQTDDPEEKEALRAILTGKYHQEEGLCGCI